MKRFCTTCGQAREADERFCHTCGTPLIDEMLPTAAPEAHSGQTEEMTTFTGMPTLAELLKTQYTWLAKNELLGPLQRLLDHGKLRADLREATERQKEAVLQGYQSYAQAQVQLFVDRIHNQRRQEAAQVDVGVMRQVADIQNTLSEAEHRRTQELQSAQHQHEREMLQLAAELTISSKIIEAGNEIQLLQLESDAKGEAKVREMQRYQAVIRENFNALAEIDASNLDYVRRLKAMGFDDLTDSESFHRIEELVGALMESMSQKILEFGYEPDGDAPGQT